MKHLSRDGLVRAGDERDPAKRLAFVSENRARFPIAMMCRVLGVSESGVHAWASRAPSARARSDGVLLERIGAFHAASHGTYGAPRIQADLSEAAYMSAASASHD